MKSQTFVLVPAWLEKALAHANKNLADMFDRETLSRILSTDDLLFYALNQEKLLIKLAPNLMSDSSWFDSSEFFSVKQMEDPSFKKKLYDCGSTQSPPSFWSVMPIDTVIPNESMENPKAYTFEVFEIKEGFMGVRILPADTLQSPQKNEYDAYNSALSTLNAFYSFDELARLSTFKHFVKLAGRLR